MKYYGAISSPKDLVNKEYVDARHGTFELIETITLSEAVETVERSAEPDGKAYGFSDALVMTSFPLTTSGNEMLQNYRVFALLDGNTKLRVEGFRNVYRNPYNNDTWTIIENTHGFFRLTMSQTTSNPAALDSFPARQSSKGCFGSKITSLNISAVGAELPVNTVIKIYGVRI